MNLIGPRPTIGWVMYFLIGRSWVRLVSLSLILVFVTAALLRRSKESMSLNFTQPSHLPRPIIILPSLNHGLLTPLDACSVEAAARPIQPSPRSGNVSLPNEPRAVYAYLWQSDVSPSHIWTKIISRLPNVKVAFLDKNKVVEWSPIEGIFESGFNGGMPDWAVWMACGGALLWRTGGILMPSGVLMRTPLFLDVFGEYKGFLVADSRDNIEPIVIGANPKDGIITGILERIGSYEEPKLSGESKGRGGNVTKLGRLLTSVVMDHCGKICEGYKVIREESVWHFDGLQLPAPRNLEDISLIKFQKSEMFSNLEESFKVFRGLRLHTFCPYVYSQVQKQALGLL